MAELFQSPSDIRSAIMRERLNQAGAATGNSAAIVGGIFGRALQGEDPRLKQARTLEEINQELTSRGLKVGDADFTKALVPMVRARLGMGPALQAQKLALEAEELQSSVRGVRQGPQAMQRQLARLGYPPDEAEDLVAVPEIARAVIKNRMKPKEATATFRNLEEAGLQPDTPEFHAAMLRAVNKPAVSLSIGNAAEKASAVKRANIETQISILDSEVERTRQKWQRAQAAFEANPNATTKLDAKNAGQEHTLARAARINWQGEPSDTVSGRIDVPGPVRQLLIDAADKASELIRGKTSPLPDAGSIDIKSLTPADINSMSQEQIEALWPDLK